MWNDFSEAKIYGGDDDVDDEGDDAEVEEQHVKHEIFKPRQSGNWKYHSNY